MAAVGQWPSVRFTQHIWEKLETEIPAYIVPSPSPSCRGFSDPFFPGEKHPCPSTPKQVEGPCSSSLVTSSPQCLGGGWWQLGYQDHPTLLMLFTPDCSHPVPLLPGTAAPHPQYHGHRVALLFLLPTAQVSIRQGGISCPQDTQTCPSASPGPW